MSSKTEQPTRQRLRRARQEGQVPRSRLFTSAAVTLLSLWALGETARGRLTGFRQWVAEVLSLPAQSPVRALEEAGLQLWHFTWPVLTVALLGGGLAAVLGAGLDFQIKPLLPKIERLHPGKGLQRILTLQTLLDLARYSLAAGVVGWVFVAGVRARVAAALQSSTRPGAEALLLEIGLIWPPLKHAALTLLALGIADLGFVRWRHRRQLMMTREEVKREYKENEGDAHAKARRRSLHRQIAQGGPARGVASATAVVVNPTHLAIALRYAPGECEAPYLVAKAREDDALALRSEAQRLGIPVVRDVPFARSLIQYDVGEEIPEELYRAAAAVLKVAHEQSELLPADEESP